MKNQYLLQRCFALLKYELKSEAKSEIRAIILLSLILPDRICTTHRHTRGKFARDPCGKTASEDILRHVMQQAATGCIYMHSPQTILQEGNRGGFNIFPRRHRGLVSPWLRLQSCGLLSSFFMFSLFDVVFLGGASHSILELARNTVRNAYHFTNFPFIPAAPLLNARGAARPIPST